MKPFAFFEPETLDAALAALAASDGSARVLAGGTDLLGQLKEGTAAYAALVSLGALDGLRRVDRLPDGGLQIGALVTLAQLELSQELAGPYRILSEAARGVATPEIRNQGTLGGNLCQRPRCLHYRHALVSCLKKGGDSCPAAESPYQDYLSVFGGPGCYAVHASDLAPALIALGATAVLRGPDGVREVGLESFFVGPDPDPARETALRPEEVLTHVRLPVISQAWRGAYSKARERTAGDFPIVSLALGFELQEGRIRNARAVLGGAAPTPLRARQAEAILEGAEPTEEAGARAAAAALAGAQPLSHNAFKLDLARALFARGVPRVAALG